MRRCVIRSSTVTVVENNTVNGIITKYIVISLFLPKQTMGGNLVSNVVKPPDSIVAMEGTRGDKTPTRRDSR